MKVNVECSFIEDDSHGWCYVPLNVLHLFDIAKYISPWSFVTDDGQGVYLEEDVDFERFRLALKDCDFNLVLKLTRIHGDWIGKNELRPYQFKEDMAGEY